MFWDIVRRFLVFCCSIFSSVSSGMSTTSPSFKVTGNLTSMFWLIVAIDLDFTLAFFGYIDHLFFNKICRNRRFWYECNTPVHVYTFVPFESFVGPISIINWGLIQEIHFDYFFSDALSSSTSIPTQTSPPPSVTTFFVSFSFTYHPRVRVQNLRCHSFLYSVLARHSIPDVGHTSL